MSVDELAHKMREDEVSPQLRSRAECIRISIRQSWFSYLVEIPNAALLKYFPKENVEGAKKFARDKGFVAPMSCAFYSDAQFRDLSHQIA